MQLSRTMSRPSAGAGGDRVLRVAEYTAEVHPEAVYQALLDHDVFAVHTCTRCGRAHYSPRVICPYCGSGALEWKRSAGVGTVYSASMLSPRDADPYAVVLVDLDDGPRLMSNVVGIPAGDVRIGMRVRVRIEPRDGGAVALFEGLGE
jgi:uncharacterized OB-fold protein